MTAASGCLSLAQEHLAVSLAASSAFRTWVGAATAAAARGSIYMEGLPDPADGADKHTRTEHETYRPYARIWTQEQAGFTKQRIASHLYHESGRLKIELIQDEPAAAADRADGDLIWKNTIGAIIDDLCTAPAGGELDIVNVTIDDGPYRNHPDSEADQGIAQGVELGITHGTT